MEKFTETVAPFAPEAVEVDDVEKDKGDDGDSVNIGTIPIDFVHLRPHDKFIESQTKRNTIDNGQSKPEFVSSGLGK